jgi:hypothetical protein
LLPLKIQPCTGTRSAIIALDQWKFEFAASAISAIVARKKERAPNADPYLNCAVRDNESQSAGDVYVLWAMGGGTNTGHCAGLD